MMFNYLYESKQCFKTALVKVGLVVVTLLPVAANAQTISPDLVGTNLWYADAKTGANPSDKVWAQTKAMGTNVIRIGGHAFDVGMPSNEIMLQWVDKVIANGAKPMIQVSQYDNATTLNDKIAAAVSMVTYINITNKRGVKYWNIGNEPWLQNGKPATSTMAALVAAYIKPIAAAMKAVDPTIKIFGPDECDFFDGYYAELFNSGGENDIAGLVPGKNYYYVDGISWHRYPQQDNVDPAVEGAADLLARVEKAKALADAANTTHGRSGANALQWGIGEYNAKGGSVVHTFENGQMFGQLLGYAMKYQAAYAATWSMFEASGSRSGTDFSMIDGNGTPRSSYRHMEFVAKYMTGTYADGVTSNTNLVAYGAVNGTQRSVMIMNRGATAQNYKLRLNKDAITTTGVKINIDANSTTEFSGNVGANTTVFLVFGTDTVKQITYSKAQFLKDQAPTEEVISLCGNNSPTINPVDPIFIDAKGGMKAIDLTGLSDGDSCSQVLTLNATSSNTAAVSAGAITYKACDTKASLALTPIAAGESIITVSVADSGIPGVCAPITKTMSFNTLVAQRVLVPALIQAENYNAMSGVELGDSDSDDGKHIAYIDKNDFVDYFIDVSTAGKYAIQIRVASAMTTPTGFELRNAAGDVLKTVTVPNTSGWQVYQTMTLLTNLPKGAEKIRLNFIGSGVNVDWIDIKSDNGGFVESNGVVTPGTASSASSAVALSSSSTSKSSSSSSAPASSSAASVVSSAAASSVDAGKSSSSGGGSINYFDILLLLSLLTVSACVSKRADKVSLFN